MTALWSWHLTWQDPIALLIALALLWISVRAARRRGRGCERCPLQTQRREVS